MKSEWAVALQKHLVEKVAPPPDGWKSIRQISEELGHSTTHTSKVVNKMVKRGLAEMKSYKCLMSVDGKKAAYSRMVPHYRLLPKAKSP
jgi:Mn-dependent DtxR family transcriptional regulator